MPTIIIIALQETAAAVVGTTSASTSEGSWILALIGGIAAIITAIGIAAPLIINAMTKLRIEVAAATVAASKLAAESTVAASELATEVTKKAEAIAITAATEKEKNNAFQDVTKGQLEAANRHIDDAKTIMLVLAQKANLIDKIAVPPRDTKIELGTSEANQLTDDIINAQFNEIINRLKRKFVEEIVVQAPPPVIIKEEEKEKEV